MIITIITGMFPSIAIPFEPRIQVFWNEIFLVFQMPIPWDVSTAGSFLEYGTKMLPSDSCY